MSPSLLVTLCLAIADGAPSEAPDPPSPAPWTVHDNVETTPRNLISVNPLTIILYGVYGFEWERWIAPHWTLYLEPAFVSVTENNSQTHVSLYAAAVGGRWYPLAVGPRGLFAGVQVLGGRGTRTDSGALGTVQRVTALEISVGAQLGYTLLVADELQLSLGLGGSVGFDNVGSADSQVALRAAPLLRAAVGFAF